jgi:hypothetical protein
MSPVKEKKDQTQAKRLPDPEALCSDHISEEPGSDEQGGDDQN